MLDPSSSEESETELAPEDEPVPKPEKVTEKTERKSEKSQNSPAHARSQHNKKVVLASPVDEKKNEQERIENEEAARKSNLQIYVFVLRCIAYPFNAKQPTDMARRQQKVSADIYYHLLHHSLFSACVTAAPTQVRTSGTSSHTHLLA